MFVIVVGLYPYIISCSNALLFDSAFFTWQEYYQSDRPSYPAHYRHSQTDLTEWEEHQQHNQFGSTAALQHVGGPRRGDVSDRYAYRNGSARENGGDWEEAERPRPR